jgi:hypothetical protein
MDPVQLAGAEAPQEIALVLKTINDETFGVHMRRDALISELKAKVKVGIRRTVLWKWDLTGVVSAARLQPRFPRNGSG